MPEAESQVSANVKLRPLFPRKRKQRTEFSLEWEGAKQEESPQGAWQQPRLFSVSGPPHWKCSFFLCKTLFFTNLIFQKLQSADREVPSPTGRKAACAQFCFLSVGPPSLKVQRERADSCRAPAPGPLQPHLESR